MLTKIIYTWHRLAKKISYDHVSAYSAQATLFILISFFPFIMFLLALLQFFPIASSEVLYAIINILPTSLHSFAVSIVTEITKKSNSALLSVTAVTYVWSASRGTLSIIRGLNSVYEIHETRNYFLLRIIASLYTLLFAGVLAATLSILVFGNNIYNLITAQFTWLNEFALFIISIRIIASLIILILFFAFIYKFVPNRRTSLINQLPGAIISTLGWLGFSSLFSIYVDNFGNYSYMYGSLATIVLIMLWLYFCMNILFFGAEVNMLIQKLSFFEKGK